MRLVFIYCASPYLAQYVLQKHTEDIRYDCLLVVAIMLSQMKMNDIITSWRRKMKLQKLETS